jgi:DnaJ-class molecular chaperone
LHITFEEAALGGTRRVKLPNGTRFDVRVPAGVREGQTIRLRGLGEAGLPGGPAGDALVTVAIEPHPYLRRDGRDIYLELPITLNEALHGAKVKVPTLQGPVTMQVPPGANAGQQLRLKGKGIPGQGLQPAGDEIVTLQIVLPDQSDNNLSDIVKRWETAHPYDPRKKFGES